MPTWEAAISVLAPGSLKGGGGAVREDSRCMYDWVARMGADLIKREKQAGHCRWREDAMAQGTGKVAVRRIRRRLAWLEQRLHVRWSYSGRATVTWMIEGFDIKTEESRFDKVWPCSRSGLLSNCKKHPGKLGWTEGRRCASA